MRIPKVTSDGSGGTRFEELDLPQSETPYAQNVPPLLVSSSLNAAGAVFVTMPGDVETEPHPAPRRQLVVVIDGHFEVSTTDGEKRNLLPGDTIVFDDLGTRGHTTTVRSTAPATFLAVPLTD
jgi:quercetin dioxygenase-like cupin family protein